MVLGRFRGEKIRIKDDIIITVLEIRNGKVMLGLDAPEDVKVSKKETVEEKSQGEEK